MGDGDVAILSPGKCEEAARQHHIHLLEAFGPIPLLLKTS
jgi:hypothetical protein